jgi:hypothetical protein
MYQFAAYLLGFVVLLDRIGRVDVIKNVTVDRLLTIIEGERASRTIAASARKAAEGDR